jgi:hypothetical protein
MNGAAVVSSGVYAGVMLAGVVVFLRRTSLPLLALLPGPSDARLAWDLARRALGRSDAQTSHA